MNALLERPVRNLFFTGKGGVGKTSLATATAVVLADGGRSVLLVSTDPASNLGQVLEGAVGPGITSVPAVPGLSALDINPAVAAHDYRERVLSTMRGVLPEAAVAQTAESLSGACTMEIAAFDEFTRLLADAGVMGTFDHVVFDTAPTGHTLRLLQLPAAWSGFIAENPEGASCLGPLSGLQARQHQYQTAVDALRDPATTVVALVSRPETAALAEAARTSEELASLGIGNQALCINGVFEAVRRDDPLALALEHRGRAALAAMPPRLAGLPRIQTRLKAGNIVGLPAVRAMLDDGLGVTSGPVRPATAPDPGQLPAGLTGLVDELATAGHGLIMTMGKGGVGKTTIAAALAVELAGRGLRVHLSTTDPAAHLEQALHGSVDGLTLSRIDPLAETRRYVDKVMATRGRDLDDESRRLLAEDLRSPCTEEVAVFHAFARLVNEARRGIVVLDTAPTGHTLLLLDAAGAYHREVQRTALLPAERIVTPLMRLRDSDYTRVLIITLPETTPVLEGAGLQDDLRRAGVEPYAWVINQSLAAAGPADPLLAARAAAEHELIRRVTGELGRRVSVLPFMAEPPVGAAALRALVSGAMKPAAAGEGVSPAAVGS